MRNFSSFMFTLPEMDWSALAQPGVMALLAVALLAVLIARAIRLQFWLLQLKYLLLAGVLLAAVQLAAYFTVFDRCELLPKLQDGTHVLLVGKTEPARSPSKTEHESMFILADPTGRVRVVTTNGPPAVGSFCIVRGKKRTDTELPFVEAGFRLSTWGATPTEPQ